MAPLNEISTGTFERISVAPLHKATGEHPLLTKGLQRFYGFGVGMLLATVITQLL